MRGDDISQFPAVVPEDIAWTHKLDGAPMLLGLTTEETQAKILRAHDEMTLWDIATRLSEIRSRRGLPKVTMRRDTGRPSEGWRHVYIMLAVEFFIGKGLKRTDAIYRVAQMSGMTFGSVEQYYKENKLLEDDSKAVREWLSTVNGFEEDIAEKIRV
jgi:hypothetical protein